MDAYTRRVASGCSLRFCVRLAVAAVCLGGLARPACATTYWWNTTTTGLWSNGTNWSTAASGGSAGQAPADSAATDDAVFNQTTAYGNTIVELNAARSINGMTFLNTGSTLLRANASGTQTLTLGARGITLGATAGPVTIGDATNAIAVTLGTGTFTNDSATPLRFVNAVNPNSNTVTVNGTGGVVFDGGIPGGAFATKAGNGNLSLNGYNPISSLTLSAGTLTISGSGTLGSNTRGGGRAWGLSWGDLTFTNSGAFVYASSAYQGVYAKISGTGSLTMAGSGVLTLDQAMTYTGPTTVSNGTFELYGSSFTSNIANSSNMVFNTAAARTYSNVLSGTGNVFQTGGANLTFTGSNTFTGPLAIQGNGVEVSFAGSGAPASNILQPSVAVSMGSNIGAATPRVYAGQTGAAWQRPSAFPQLIVTGSANVSNSQSLAGLTINDGMASVTLTAPATGAVTLNMGGLQRSAGSRGLAVFYPSATGTVSMLTTATNTNGIVGGWAIVSAGGTVNHWATSAAAGGTAGALTAYSAYTPDSWSPGANTNVTGTGNNTIPANAVTNSLRFATGATLTLAGTATISSGGILLIGGSTGGAAAITGGALRGPAGGSLLVAGAQGAWSYFTVSSPIVDNGGPTGLTLAPFGGASFYGYKLSGNSTYTGRTLLLGSPVIQSFDTGTSGPLGVGGAIEFPSNGGATTVGGAIVYDRLNSTDYSPRFTTAANQTYAATIPSNQRVTWASSFGSDTAALNATLNGDLLLTGSNSFPNGVYFNSSGGPGALILGSANAVGSVGSISTSGWNEYSALGARLVFTAASAGLDLGSRLASNNNWMQLDTNGQTVTFATAVNLTGGAAALIKTGDGRLTLSGGLTSGDQGLFLVGGTVAIDATTLATAMTAVPLIGSGASTFQYIGAAGASRVQNVNGVSLTSGQLTVAVENPGTTTTVNFGGAAGTGLIVRGTAQYNTAFKGQLGTVDFRAVSGTFGTTAIVRTGTAQVLTNGILGPWATVNGTDWATHTSGTILPYAGYTDVTTGTIADGATMNARITTTTGTVVLGVASTTVNTLLQSAPTAATISLPAGQALLTGGVMAAAGAGRLTIGDAVGVGTLQPATAGGEIVLSNFSSGTMTVNSVIANNTSASRLTVAGNGTIVLTASNTLTGTTGLHGGTLRIGNGGTTGSLATSSVFLAAGATLVFDRSDDYGGAVTYPITSQNNTNASPGGVVVRGGSLTLSAANTYHGSTVLAGGTTTLGAANALSSRLGPITFTGGVMRYGSGVTDDLSGRIAGSTSPIVVDTNGQAPTWGYILASSNVAGLTKRGGGTLTFTNMNSYQGTTTIEAGAIKAPAQGLPGNIVNSGTLIFSTDALNVGGVHAGTISGTGRVVVNGTAFLPTTLTGTNTFAVVPVVEQGRLDIGWSAPAGQASPLGTSGTVTLGTTGIGGLLGYSGAANLTFDRVLDLAGATLGGGVAADGAGAFILTSDLRVSGAGTKPFMLAGSGTAANEFRGVIANNSGTNLTNISKTGGGVWQLTGANTFTGTVSITEGTLSVATLTNAGANGPLGAGTGNSAAIRVGSTAAAAALRYTGTGHSTNRGVILTGTGILEAMGSGAATFSTVTGSAGVNTLVLGGTSLANNTLGVITDSSTPGATSVVKDGSGVWRLTTSSSFSGGLTVRNGTVIADVNSGGTDNQAGAFGTANDVTVGDATAGAAGTAALLLSPGVGVSKRVVVPASAGGTQTVLLGSTGTGATVASFDNEIQLSRSVTLVASAGGTTSFSNTWATGTGVNISVGTVAYPGTVLVNRDLATTGAVGVRYGALNVVAGKTLTSSGLLSIDLPGSLVGSGVVAATLGGAGLVAPGNSPGILTAQGVNPTGGLDFNFEFSGTAPDYTNASASVNDVLRLTGGTPFTAGLNASNVMSIYLSGSGNMGDVFQGGFFTDLDSTVLANFQTLMSSGSVVGYYQKAGGAYAYNGQAYALLTDLGRSLQAGVTTVASAGFNSGANTVTNGQVTTFTIGALVPEPGSLALAAFGIGLAGWAIARRRRVA